MNAKMWKADMKNDFVKGHLVIDGIERLDALENYAVDTVSKVYHAAMAHDGDLSAMVAMDFLSMEPRISTCSILSAGRMQKLSRIQKEAES